MTINKLQTKSNPSARLHLSDNAIYLAESKSLTQLKDIHTLSIGFLPHFALKEILVVTKHGDSLLFVGNKHTLKYLMRSLKQSGYEVRFANQVPDISKLKVIKTPLVF